MQKILTVTFSVLFISVLLIQNIADSQTVYEKEMFTLKYKGTPDVYSFYYDKTNGKYLYSYYDETDKKSFLISNNSVSKKYDYISVYDKKTDSKGNTFIVAGNYSSDFGPDNNFILVNGIEKLNYDYIESYSSFINKNDEFVFVFKEKDKYRIGRYSTDKGLSKSGEYEFVRAMYRFNENSQKEGDAEDAYTENDFYKDENGERCFICVSNGKAALVFETREIKTDYSDINDGSLTKNKNNELSYIAKNGGRFYEKTGNEVVVSGDKIYNTFQTIYPPVLFNSENEPVYSCSDSISENKSNYYTVIGNSIQSVQDADSSKPMIFSSWISGLKIISDGEITYTGMDEIMIPAVKADTGASYDEYYTKSYYVNNNSAHELGYNLGTFKFTPDGKMLYSGIADLGKKEYLLIESNGITNIILSEEKFDMVYEYGYTANNEIYYIGQNYADEISGSKNITKLFIGNKLIGSFDYLLHQTTGKKSSVLKFDSENNYAFVAEEIINTTTFSDRVYLNNKILPLPVSAVKGANDHYLISGLMFSKKDILFYIGEIKSGVDKSVKEIFIDNGSAGKLYDMIGDINYDSITDEVNFLASKGEKIYSVNVKFY